MGREGQRYPWGDPRARREKPHHGHCIPPREDLRVEKTGVTALKFSDRGAFDYRTLVDASSVSITLRKEMVFLNNDFSFIISDVFLC